MLKQDREIEITSAQQILVAIYGLYCLRWNNRKLAGMLKALGK